MASFSPVIQERSAPSRSGAVTVRRGWGWSQWLALSGVPVALLEIWTLGSWLADGPRQITEYRGEKTIDYYSAPILEIVTVLISIWVLRRVIKDCRTQKQILTFDVMFLICGLSMFWASGIINFFMPMFSYSSYFINLNDPCGHIPFIVNPDCGRIPNAVVFVTGLETTVLLAFIWFTQWVTRKAEERWPSMSRNRSFAVMFLVSCVLVLAEPLLLIPARAWDWPGTPISITLPDGHRYPLFPELIAFALFVALPTALRAFRDDKGHTLIERGLGQYSPKVRKAITLMALYFVMQFIVWIPGTGIDWPLGFYSVEWVKLEPTLNNGHCNQPGIAENTRYGPCPGSPGFRMPVPGSLPGKSP